jgi:hypothetical protein
MLTPPQCRHSQAPALAALLLKLHLNCHTPHAALFVGPKYGGLSIPDLHVEQEYQQLLLFVGHIKLRDENGLLILSLLSHLKVYIGTIHPILTLPFSCYIKWVDMNWITSIWYFKSMLAVTIDHIPSLDNLRPTTIPFHNSAISSTPSTTSFPIPHFQPDKTLWNPALQATPVFYQRLIGENLPTELQCEQIKEAIEQKELITCSDGAFCPHAGEGSHSWVFHQEIGGTLASGAGTSDGHPALVPSYRAELGGILASLLILNLPCLQLLPAPIRPSNPIL